MFGECLGRDPNAWFCSGYLSDCHFPHAWVNPPLRKIIATFSIFSRFLIPVGSLGEFKTCPEDPLVLFGPHFDDHFVTGSSV